VLTSTTRAELRAGARAVAPMLVGVVPFGLVAGATPVTNGLGAAAAVGFSAIVFAGASQLAAIDVLGSGGSPIVAALAAWTINLRLLLYSASLAPYLARERLRTRLWIAYLLTDQAYAVCVSRWGRDDDPRARVPFFAGGALLLWGSWQLSTLAGALIGATVPEDVPLTFAVPLVFLVLLVPAVNGRPAAVAAAVGGAAAVVAAEAGAGELSLMIGAVSGIVAGTLAELRWPFRLPDIPEEGSG
jgi:predicted branched-subunit amino acid permease